MTQFQGSHILSVNQFDLTAINRIFAVARQMSPYAMRQKRSRVLDGAVLGNLFFEPSTRTRVSFGSAFNLLGGYVRETTGLACSSLTKGESLYDTARVLSTYADVIAMRHPEPLSVEAFSLGSRVPVINGGDGSNEHPTQALLDLFTIEKELARQGRDIAEINIAMVGDLRFGRTVHSLSRLLCLYPQIHFTLISPKELSMPDAVLAAIDNAGHRITITDQLEENIANADILYLTRIQEERFSCQEEANRYRGKFRLNQQIYRQHCQSNTVIMHPLPRDSRATANELDDDLNAHPNLAIFRQADNGLLIRMALFALTLGVDNQLQDYECPVNWYSNKHER